MLKNLLLKAVQSAIEDAVKSGKAAELLTQLLTDLLRGQKMSLTAENTPANSTLKDILIQALLNMVQELLASGKLNDLILKVLQGLLGSQSYTLPVTATKCGDVEINGDTLQFTHDDGKVHTVDLTDLFQK